MKTKVDLRLRLSFNRSVSRKELKQVIEFIADNLLDSGNGMDNLYSKEFNPNNNQMPLKIEHHFVSKLRRFPRYFGIDG